MELCGGTHVKRTGDIGLVKIVAKVCTSAAGVRRIEALTADGARERLALQDARVRELAGPHCAPRPDDVIERSKALLEERQAVERDLANAERQLALGGGAGRQRRDPGRGGHPHGRQGQLLARTVQGLNPKDLRGLVDDGKKQVGSGIVAIVGVTEDGKAGVAVGVTDDLTGTYSAVDLVKVGAAALGGEAAAAARTWPRPAVPTAPRRRPP